MSDPVTYDNAICLPCVGCEDKPLFPHADGGVFDADKKPIRDAFLVRYYRQDPMLVDGKWDRSTGQKLKQHNLIRPGTINGKAKRLSGTYIFAGYLFPHFGHFLLESLTNLWFFKQHPETPIIWLGVHNQPDLDPIAKQFIELYSIENPVHILTDETVVERLVVPTPGYIIHTRYTKEQQKALQMVEAPDPKPGKKVWLSRSKLKEGTISNEVLLEKVLDKEGWIIFHPQDHPIPAQLDMLKDAEVVSGIEGSAFHSLMLIPDFKGKIKIVARRRNVEFDFVAIAEDLGWDQDVIYAGSRVWSHGLPHWGYNTFWNSLDPIFDALGVSRPGEPATAPSDSLTKISLAITSRLKRNAALEFWARKNTIGAEIVDCETLIVSPHIEFNTKNLRQGVLPLDITPDQLFTSSLLNTCPNFICFRHHDNEQDLVRAFNTSIEVAPAETIWAIEYYADERTRSEINIVNDDERLESANTRLIHYIINCFPMLSVARVLGSNVAIVWRQPKQMFYPSLASFSDLATHEQFERAPVLTLSEIATLFSNPDKHRPT